MPETVSASPEPAHHVRIRRTKRLLRYMPRRTEFHRYPIVGRFASLARSRAYLWTFRSSPVRRAFYFGSVLSLLPLMGVQLPVGFVLSLVARCNFMILGALQFITNPFTALPIYGGTFLLGRKILERFGFDLSAARLPSGWQDKGMSELFGGMELGSALGQALLCLAVGGVVSGLVLGALLDAGYLLGARSGRRSASSPTGDSRPPL
jgi:uncharacterized protein (DUF2062 family)